MYQFVQGAKNIFARGVLWQRGSSIAIVMWQSPTAVVCRLFLSALMMEWGAKWTHLVGSSLLVGSSPVLTLSMASSGWVSGGWQLVLVMWLATGVVSVACRHSLC